MDYTPAYAAPRRAAGAALAGHAAWLLALATGLFALACYAGAAWPARWSAAWAAAAAAALIALNLARRAGAALALLLAAGVLAGLAAGPLAPGIAAPAGAAALAAAGLGSAGYAASGELSAVGRVAFAALAALAALSVLLIAVRVPAPDTAWSLLALAVLTGLSAGERARLRRAGAPASAASVILGVFRLAGPGRRSARGKPPL